MWLSIFLFLSEFSTFPKIHIPRGVLEYRKHNHFSPEELMNFIYIGWFLTIFKRFGKLFEKKQKQRIHIPLLLQHIKFLNC
jgi:hypothetical protein